VLLRMVDMNMFDYSFCLIIPLLLILLPFLFQIKFSADKPPST